MFYLNCENFIENYFQSWTVCLCYPLPVRLAFDAIEEVEPEVTAAAAAAIEVDVGKAVMEEAAEDDPGIQYWKIVKIGC